MQLKFKRIIFQFLRYHDHFSGKARIDKNRENELLFNYIDEAYIKL